MYEQSVFPLILVGLTTRIGVVQLHGTLTVFAGPVKVRVPVKPWVGQEPCELLAILILTCIDCPGARVPLAGLKLTNRPWLEKSLLDEVDQERLLRAFWLLLTVAVHIQPGLEAPPCQLQSVFALILLGLTFNGGCEQLQDTVAELLPCPEKLKLSVLHGIDISVTVCED